MKVLVIGAGIFGCNIALELSKIKYDVDLIDKENEIMKMASLNNHNRLHLGYHYLRSIKTAEQSLDGLISFLFHYGSSVYHSFNNYYAIAKDGSFTSASQFVSFCDEVGIDYDEEYPENYIMNKDMLEASFKVPEPIFDFKILKEIIHNKLRKSKVQLLLSKECNNLVINDNGTFMAKINQQIEEYDIVVNATYSDINQINGYLDIKPSKLKYEDVFIPIFQFDHAPFGLTIMDGPFCSVMPHGKNQNNFLLYHVEHSVLQNKIDINKPKWNLKSFINENEIYQESAKYYPFLKDVKRIQNYRSIRTVHENKDDARLTELFTYKDIPNYFMVLSGKISTSIQVALAIKHHLQGKKGKKLKLI
jgi:hypothetical protein